MFHQQKLDDFSNTHTTQFSVHFRINTTYRKFYISDKRKLHFYNSRPYEAVSSKMKIFTDVMFELHWQLCTLQ